MLCSCLSVEIAIAKSFFKIAASESRNLGSIGRWGVSIEHQNGIVNAQNLANFAICAIFFFFCRKSGR